MQPLLLCSFNIPNSLVNEERLIMNKELSPKEAHAECLASLEFIKNELYRRDVDDVSSVRSAVDNIVNFLHILIRDVYK